MYAFGALLLIPAVLVITDLKLITRLFFRRPK